MTNHTQRLKLRYKKINGNANYPCLFFRKFAQYKNNVFVSVFVSFTKNILNP
uniref:Uncharacterized protein n=1 Tax=Siphoviridae sp. ctX581 TaxID=2826365 RepID=A0A8S5MDK1_9CAUD|nr:MAG TPA: hypothetical protein [Siphoviridae sp. ctX581]